MRNTRPGGRSRGGRGQRDRRQPPGRDVARRSRRAAAGEAGRRREFAPKPVASRERNAVERAGSAPAAPQGRRERPPRRFTRRRGSRFTGRTAILALVVALVLLTLGYPTREYFAQQQEIARLRDAESAQQQRIADLQERKDKWQDPAYIKSQARERLQYVEPGEVAYVIIEDDTEKKPGKRAKATDHGPWYSQIWSTVQAADDPKATK